ncbi:hypothetical protein SPLC1_S204850 [Arthrospira platensis C1]|nr:hypothetical protein SPLC1_S204850 [Arthrospira platensis C1]
MHLQRRQFGGHSDLESCVSPHSCGTAPDLRRTFPLTSDGCSPSEPTIFKHDNTQSGDLTKSWQSYCKLGEQR